MAYRNSQSKAPAMSVGAIDPMAGEAEPAQDDDEQDPGDLLEDGKRLFKLASERERQNRDNYVKDIEFGRLEEQWPEEIRKAREDAGLPCLTLSQMNLFIHQVINDTRQNKPQILVRPVDSGADRWTAQVIAGVIRHIENISNADAAYDTAVDCSASGGMGAFRIAIEDTHDDSFDQDVKINRVADPLTIYGDPRSMSVDSLDWNDAFITDAVPEDEFKRENPGAELVDFAAPDAAFWREDDLIITAEWWHRDQVERPIVQLSNGWVMEKEVYAAEKDLYDALGLTVRREKMAKSHKVTQRIMTGAEIIETNDHPGKYIPIVPVYGEEVVLKGKRHFRSLIRSGKDAQRNFNYWRSKSAEAVGQRVRETWLGHESAFTGDYEDRWDTANRVAHPFLAVPDGVDLPTRVSMGSADAGALQEAANAITDMRSTIGIFNAGLGQQSNAVSGKAYNAQKIESDTGTFHFTDNLSRGIRCAGVIILDLLPHVYTPGRIVRVLGVDGVENHVQLGDQNTIRQAAISPMAAPSLAAAPGAMPSPTGQGGAMSAGMPGGVPGLGGQMGLPGPAASPAIGPAVAPAGGQIDPMQSPAAPAPLPKPMEGQPDWGRIYDIGLGKYDIVVQAGPGYTTRRQEAADQMLQLVQHFPQLAAVIGDIIARNLDWPGADEIEQRLKLLLPPQLRDQGDPQSLSPQLQQQAQQAQALIQHLMAALKQCQAELQAAKTDNQSEVMKQQVERMSVEVDSFNAQTKRLEAETKRGEAIIGAVQGSAGMPGSPRAPGQPPVSVPGAMPSAMPGGPMMG